MTVIRHTAAEPTPEPRPEPRTIRRPCMCGATYQHRGRRDPVMFTAWANVHAGCKEK